MENKLKPCPFCYGEASFIGDSTSIKCKRCGGAYIVTNPVKSRLDVAQSYNTRGCVFEGVKDFAKTLIDKSENGVINVGDLPDFVRDFINEV